MSSDKPGAFSETLDAASSSPRTVALDSHAVATLRYIRDSMEAATSFAVPGSAGIAMGVTGLLAAALCASPTLHPYWLEVWLLAGVIATALGISQMIRPSSLRGLTLSGTPVRKFALCMFPALFAGVVMTVVHWAAGNMHAIPGTWLLMYGCALVASSVPTTRTIGIMGGLFIALGLIAFLLPDDLQGWPLGVGFGGLHVLFGILIGWMGRGRQV